MRLRSYMSYTYGIGMRAKGRRREKGESKEGSGAQRRHIVKEREQESIVLRD